MWYYKSNSISILSVEGFTPSCGVVLQISISILGVEGFIPIERIL